MTPFEKTWAFILSEEGGFQDNPKDKGNWTGGRVNVGELKGTKYGISAASYPKLDIKNLTEADARKIFDRDYWSFCKCGQMPSPIAMMVADIAFNQGQPTAAYLLQEAVGTKQDGIIGVVTIGATRNQNLKNTLSKLMAGRCQRYATAKDVALWGGGWFRRAAACLMTSLEPL